MKRLLLLVILLSLINVGCKLAKFDREIFSDDQSSQDIDNAVADGESENETGTETETELYDKEIFNDDVSNIDFNEIDTVPDVEESGFCGDLIINNNEVCDGGTKECAEIDSFVFYSGNASCKDDCSGWDVSLCTPIIDGDICNGGFFVSSQANIDKIHLCREITGFLSIKKTYIDKIDLPVLETIGHNFTLSENHELKNIDMPALKFVGGTLEVLENPVLEFFHVPLLENVSNSLEISYNGKLKSFSMPLVIELSELKIWNNDDLEIISLPSFVGVSYDIFIVDNLSLLSFTAPNVKGSFRILQVAGNPLLKSLELNKVEKIESDLFVNGNTSLVKFSMPHLVSIGDDFELSLNSSLQSFDLLLLSNIKGDLTIKDNPNLPQIMITDFFDQISDRDGIEGTVTIGDNGP